MPSQEAIVAAQGGSLHEHRKTTRRMRWWYESLADFMMANPHATQNEIAAHFGRGVSTISTIVNTDAFKAYMRQRRASHSEALDSAVRGKLLQVADKGLDMLLEKLDKKRDSLPLDALQRTVDSSLKSLGFGSDSRPTPNVVVNNNQIVTPAVSLQDLEQARAALRRSQLAETTAPTIDGVAVRVTPDED